MVSSFFVDTIIMDDDADELMNDYDLVLTTVTHYDTVAKSLTRNREKLMAADVSLSRKTVVSLCALPHDCTIGILCQSNKFANLIAEQVEIFTSHRKAPPVCFDTDPKAMRRFMRRFRAVIAAPDSPLFDANQTGSLLDEYMAAQNQVIVFDYLIDRGSLLHIEEQIDRIIGDKAR